ncbi:MAG: polysaccharide deacetylase family protein [Bacilli bacterium]|nr:polysaccharide deacetylase family protein [Bacilli bacterium]
MKHEIDFIIKVLFILLLSLISILIIFTKPNITLRGNEVMEVNYNTEFKDPGYIATFIVSNVTKKVKVKGFVDTTKLGVYKIDYNLSINGFKNSKSRIVKVVDKKKPVIELIGNGNTCPGKSYVEEGYKAIDEIDGDLTSLIKVNVLDEKVVYSVTDKSGNSSIATRKLNIIDDIKPTITLNGSNYITIYTGGTYNELGANVTDNCDDQVALKIDGNVDTSKVGKYNITYTATDKSGNTESIIRTINVVDRLKDGIGKNIYLTFDDGPGPLTQQFLAILDKYGVKATFFVTNQFPNYQYLIGEEAKRGHAIAVHTYTHSYDVVYKSVDSYVDDFNRMNEIIKQQTGSYSNMFRYPGGSSNTVHCSRNPGVTRDIADTMLKLGYQYFDWNLSSGDASGYATRDSVYKAVANGAGASENTVILMHDIKSSTLSALPSIIENLQSRGFTFKTLDKNSFAPHHSFGICR